ncbi:MAG TPA: hypothetical protein PKG96_05410 [Bacilli bacterium]|nr:hypothetical protein [Bacilli bacterium]
MKNKFWIYQYEKWQEYSYVDLMILIYDDVSLEPRNLWWDYDTLDDSCRIEKNGKWFYTRALRKFAHSVNEQKQNPHRKIVMDNLDRIVNMRDFIFENFEVIYKAILAARRAPKNAFGMNLKTFKFYRSSFFNIRKYLEGKKEKVRFNPTPGSGHVNAGSHCFRNFKYKHTWVNYIPDGDDLDYVNRNAFKIKSTDKLDVWDDDPYARYKSWKHNTKCRKQYEIHLKKHQETINTWEENLPFKCGSSLKVK